MATRSHDLWTRSVDGFPAAASLNQQMRFLLGYAVLAPSGHNTQPWLFRVGSRTVDVLADRARALPIVDPQDRELVISCGAALGILEIAARRFGLKTAIVYSPDANDSDVLARVRLAPGPAPLDTDIALFDAIQKRRTNRTAYEMTPLPEDLLRACNAAAADRGLVLSVLQNSADRAAVAALVAEGDRLQFDDPAFRKELSHWVRSTQLGGQDGMSGASFGMPDILSAVGGLVIRTFDLGGGVAASDEKKITSASPALLVLGSPEDNPTCWLDTGRALGRMLIILTAQGFAASYLNQPVEIAELRPRLQSVAKLNGYPQILLRVGQALSEPSPAARRDLNDVILN